MGRLAPDGLLGIHTNLLVTGLAGAQSAETEEENSAIDQLATFRATGFGYFLEKATRPQTISYALLDSPAALAAWLLDHDTDSYYKISGAFVDGEPAGNLTRDHIVDNITLYWLTGTGDSAARAYWAEDKPWLSSGASGQAPPEVALPVGFTTFPGEIWRHRELGRERPTLTSSTSTKSTRAATSPPRKSRNSSPNEIRAAFRPLRELNSLRAGTPGE